MWQSPIQCNMYSHQIFIETLLCALGGEQYLEKYCKVREIVQITIYTYFKLLNKYHLNNTSPDNTITLWSLPKPNSNSPQLAYVLNSNISIVVIYCLLSSSHLNVNSMNAGFPFVLFFVLFSLLAKLLVINLVSWCGKKSWKLIKMQMTKNHVRELHSYCIGIVNYRAHCTACFAL